MSGKGDKRRPSAVPDEVLAERWASTFGHVAARPGDTPPAPETPAKGEG